MSAQTEEVHIDVTKSLKQRDFVVDDRRFLVWIGGRNTSKTTSGVLHIMRLVGDPAYQGARILVFGPNYPQMRKGTLVTFDKWFDRTNLVLEKINGNEPERRLVNDIVVYFRNATNPDQTRGHETRIVWLDEAAQMSPEVFRLANATLRQEDINGNRGGYQTIITTTPRGKNWLYSRFKDPATCPYTEDQLGYYTMTTLEAHTVGFATDEYVADIGYAEGSEMYRQEVLGEFVSWAGLVFDYRAQRDTPDPFILPQFKRVVGGVDIGITAPTALILIGEDAQGRFWVFKEYYQKRADFHEWVRVCGEWTREYNVRSWHVDSAANMEIAMMRRAGLVVKPSVKAKDAASTAVNYINSLMKRDMFRLSPDCLALRTEMETYQFKEQLSGEEITFLDKVKVGQQEHAIDALRYATMGLGGLQKGTAGGWGEFTFSGRAA